MLVGRDVIFFSLVIGLLVTLLTSFIINNTVIGEFPNLSFVSIPMVGVSYWGYPLPWLKQVIYPGQMKEPILTHLAIDVAYWAGLVLMIKVLYLRKVKVKDRIAKKVDVVGRIRSGKRVMPTKPEKFESKKPGTPVRKRKTERKSEKTKKRTSKRASRGGRKVRK